ncbi:MAG TPA: glycosyltransferase [Gemmatimonadota bacterium]|nr:glycosyltransferase [Gemmatimonadota bacterium]
MSREPAPDAAAVSGPPPHVSILVPALDEAPNMPDLFGEIGAMLSESGLDAEVVLVDDGSDDGTLEAARRAAREAGVERTRLLRHRRNRGKTDALLTGARAARGEILVLFDADLQHAPSEIPRFVRKVDDGWDMVVGRKVGRYEKRFVSGIYNWLARKIFRVPVHDLNAMKAFRRDVLDDLRLRSDWHRYLVVLAHARGYAVTEIEVDLHPRRHGISKYSGRSRIVVGVLDLVSVWFQLVFSRRPMLLFGVTGLFLVGAGTVVGLIALYLRFVLRAGYRPLLTLVLLLMVVGVLLFAIGFLAELIASLRGEVDDLRQRLEDRP